MHALRLIIVVLGLWVVTSTWKFLLVYSCFLLAATALIVLLLTGRSFWRSLLALILVFLQEELNYSFMTNLALSCLINVIREFILRYLLFMLWFIWVQNWAFIIWLNSCFEKLHIFLYAFDVGNQSFSNRKRQRNSSSSNFFIFSLLAPARYCSIG